MATDIVCTIEDIDFTWNDFLKHLNDKPLINQPPVKVMGNIMTSLEAYCYLRNKREKERKKRERKEKLEKLKIKWQN